MSAIEILDLATAVLDDASILRRKEALLRKNAELRVGPYTQSWIELNEAQVELCDKALRGDVAARRRVAGSIAASVESRGRLGLLD